MKRYLRAALAAIVLLLALRQAAAAQGAPRVVAATVDGPIVAVVYDYLNRAIGIAEQDGADAVLVRLNTPGGDVATTERIIQRFGASRVPVIVYVTPRRGAAFSAGTLITLGGHLAAMAPETQIGAAKPISGSGDNLDSDSRDKAVNALRAMVRTLARNRPPGSITWAEQTITQAVAATEEEALKLGVIDLIASDERDLLVRADGRTIVLNGRAVTLHTANASVRNADMTWGESLLYILINPNIAAILLFIAVNGLLIEWQSPGIGFGGIAGAIAFILFLYAVGTLPVNLTGLLFIGLAVALFIFDITATQHGALTLGGVAAFCIGALILFEPSYVPLSLGLVAALALLMGSLFLFVFGKGYAVRRLKPVLGAQAMLGRAVTARTDLAPQGFVYVEGALWEATSESGAISAGEPVVITAIHGLKLTVRSNKSQIPNSNSQ
ncbi:MAG: nodulation protein NfeD [Chloroflexi bacterium]|nr:nodulation protein NfeD [Chloroflexota bacterium]